MASQVHPHRPTAAEFARRALRPPAGELRFWLIQLSVILLAGLHLYVDLSDIRTTGAFPEGIPVALLIIPVGYAAMRYGLAGSAATGLWATLLWLPDLVLPGDQGHVGADVVNLALVDIVAFVFGQQIESERLERARVERATAERLSVEAGYRQLFEANRAPILVLDGDGSVRDANRAAVALLGAPSRGVELSALLSKGADLADLPGRVVTLADGRDYRIGLAALPPRPADSPGGPGEWQMMLEDVTEERSENRRATRYAALVVAAEEDQRRRLARELHDEPLQLFLHLARRLESLATVPGVPTGVTGGLAEARAQALEAATRLRTLARDLRPPALDQLGLVAALSSFLADVEEETGLRTRLEVAGGANRLAPDIELGAFRIVQEAVHNTIRHAGAGRIQVGVTFAPELLALCVEDDGRGFRPERAGDLSSGHLGLLGMHERAGLLGGTLELRSAPGRGTSVHATLPVLS
ncbi:MAG TPA: ATP-binding protein [Acidimicrobiales bacterium]|nr:ATP-binding protein [Acidimicrobiales bacterium]